MSAYLLNIAARSTQNANNNLLPSTPAINIAGPETVSNFANESNIQDRIGENKSGQQNLFHVLPDPLQKAQPAVVLYRTEIKDRGENIRTSYFSKHVERVEAGEENGTVKAKPAATVSDKIDQPFQKAAAENVVPEPVTNESVSVNKKDSKIIPDKNVSAKQSGKNKTDYISKGVQADEMVSVKKQIINPGVEPEDQKKDALRRGNLPVVRLTPNQPHQVNKISVQNNKMKEAGPKLVIGNYC